MNDKMKKYIIIIASVFIALLIFSICLNIKKNKKEYEESSREFSGVERVVDSKPVEVEDFSEYYTVVGCTENYLSYIYNKDSDKLYDILNKEYKETNGITKENLYEKIGEFKISQILRVKKIVEVMENKDQSRFFVYATIRNSQSEEDAKAFENMNLNETSEDIDENIDENMNIYEEVIEERQPESEFLIEVKLDFPNSTYEIVPNHSRINDQIDLEKDASVEPNDNNVYETVIVNEEDASICLFEDFKEKAFYYPKEAYETLDEEYKNKKFPTFEDFKKYIDENHDRIDNVYVDQFGIDSVQNAKKYILKDQYENFYVFNCSSAMNYKLMLDIYTVPLDENIETYQIATDQEKVAMNINKWIMALNTRDYKYMYGVLNETFKQNNIPTIEAFTEFAKNDFFSSNKLEFGAYSVEGTTHIYEIELVDRENEEQYVAVTIMMKLKDDNSFEMSYEME